MKERFRIVWTEEGKAGLKKVYRYYAAYSERSAKALLTRVFRKVNSLKTFPQIGPVQEFPIKRKREYRYLIERHYKILYQISGNLVVIVEVFDTRQDPAKLEKLE